MIDPDTCRSHYPGTITSNMLCIGKRDGCKIRKGAPVECNGKLQGVFSWDNIDPLCKSDNGVGVFVKMCNFNSWIRSTMSSN